MKKLFVSVLFLALVIPMAVMLTACGSSGNGRECSYTNNGGSYNNGKDNGGNDCPIIGTWRFHNPVHNFTQKIVLNEDGTVLLSYYLNGEEQLNMFENVNLEITTTWERDGQDVTIIRSRYRAANSVWNDWAGGYLPPIDVEGISVGTLQEDGTLRINISEGGFTDHETGNVVFSLNLPSQRTSNLHNFQRV